MKKILVTGGFGFIGSSLVEILVKDKKNRVHVIDDMSTSPIDIQDFLETIDRPKNLSFEITTVKNFFSKKYIGNWNEIYHLASPVGPVGVLKHAGEMIREVVRDSYSIADYCLKKKSELLYVSTSEVYGGGQEGYCSESMQKIIPAHTTVRLEYAMAKLAMETALVNLYKTKKLRTTIIRPFNIAGKRQSSSGGFVVPRFIQQAHQNLPITVFGDGRMIRAFTNVKDIAEGLILVMAKGKKGEIYNIGNSGNKIRILDLAKRIKKILNSESEIKLVNPKKIFGPLWEEANDKYPDAKKVEEHTGWTPKYDIDSTLRDAYEEYLRLLKKGILRHTVEG
jgi:UDP-glucose 4-epimerase